MRTEEVVGGGGESEKVRGAALLVELRKVGQLSSGPIWDCEWAKRVYNTSI